MQPRLSGQRIALFEARLATELSELVRRSGGVPVCVPAVRERRRPATLDVGALLAKLQLEPQPNFVFSTGVGASALFDEARALGRDAELREAMTRGTTVCRGPKPVAALHREGVTASIKARSPFTTAELIEALDQVELRDRMTILLHYGERNAPLVDALLCRGAWLYELTLYEWELPEDTGPLQQIIEDLACGRFAAAAFTTQIQFRNLLAVADGMGRGRELLEALRERVVVAAVGPTCARVLADRGIAPRVVPESPKMGPMVSALVEHLAPRDGP